MRIFVGLPLPQEVTSALEVLSRGLPNARWVAPENMHVTLRFIGEVDGGQLDEIAGALAGIDAPAFSLGLHGMGKFGTGRHLRALWAGVEPEAPVAFLAAKADSAVVRSGLEPEHRKFMPHVTLARLKGTPEGRVAAWLEDHGNFKTEPFSIDHFVLYRSHLGKQAAHYEVLAEYPLQ